MRREPNEDFEVDESQFWELVHRAHDAASDDMDQKCEVLKAEIGKLSKNEANDFAILFDGMMDTEHILMSCGAPPMSFTAVAATTRSSIFAPR